MTGETSTEDKEVQAVAVEALMEEKCLSTESHT
jgi:hypothetical protein